jgi:hypothetical protein
MTLPSVQAPKMHDGAFLQVGLAEKLIWPGFD